MKRAAKDTGWVAAASGASRGLVFVAVIVIARLLPIDDFAAYVVLLAVWTLLVPLADAGMWPLVMRTASKNPGGRVFRFTGEADRARALVWAAGIGIAAILALADPWPRSELCLLIVFAAIGQAEVDTASAELAGRRRFAAASVLRMLPGVIGLVGAITLPLFGTSTASAMTVFAVARVLPAIGVRMAVPLSSPTRMIFLRLGLPFGLTGGLVTLYVSCDLILLPAFGIAAAGIAVYGVAYRTLVGLQLVIPSALALALYPRVAAASQDASPRLIRLAVGASACISAVLLVIVFLDLQGLFSIFGSSYARSIQEVRSLLLVLLPLSMSVLYTAGLQARHHERVVLRLVIVVALVNIVGNLALIPLLGIRGALIATSGAEWLAAVGALAISIRLCAVPASDVLPCISLVVPSSVGFLPVPALYVSLAIVMWLMFIWVTNGFDLRLTFNRLRHGGRLMPAAGSG